MLTYLDYSLLNLQHLVYTPTYVFTRALGVEPVFIESFLLGAIS